MKSQHRQSRIRGCILGAALGDALGAPFEFRPFEYVHNIIGKPWINGLYPFDGTATPHGIWKDSAPAGTGTDDTRYNWLFLELAAHLGRMPSAKEVARRFIDIYRDPKSVFPSHPDHARKQFETWEGVCCGQLGQKSEQHPTIPPAVLRERSVGLNYPTLIGLITLTSAGLAFPGRPEQAYAAAYETDFFDIGYARESVSLLAAAVSLAVVGNIEPKDIFDQILGIDPFDLGGVFGGPFVKEKLPSFLASIPRSCSDEELAEHLSRALRNYHVFDPFKTLATAFSSVLSRPTDPLRAIIIALNHRGVADDGKLAGYQDIDCYGGVTGALAGAIAGAEAFPSEMVDRIIASNRAMYGFDLDSTIEKFTEKFC